MWEIDYDKAASVWVEKDKNSVHMEEGRIWQQAAFGCVRERDEQSITATSWDVFSVL